MPDSVRELADRISVAALGAPGITAKVRSAVAPVHLSIEPAALGSSEVNTFFIVQDRQAGRSAAAVPRLRLPGPGSS